MITGSIVALVTPMHIDGSIDFDALSSLIEWHVDQGTDSIVAVGTTGESATLTVDEHCQVVAHTVKTVAGRIPVIAGTGANSTAEAIELTASAKRVGVDACLLVTPYYNKPNQKGLEAHYRAIAAAVDIPQILYNVPGRTACDMLPETALALSSVENIVGIKEATGDLDRAKTLLAQCPKDFAVYSGDDAIACEMILAGAMGNISVTANVAPALMHEMCAQASAGNEPLARQADAQVAALHKALFVEANPIPVKWALKEMGRMGEGIRLPLVELDSAFHPVVVQALKEAGAL